VALLGGRLWKKCGATTGSGADTTSNLNNASNLTYAPLLARFGTRRGEGAQGGTLAK
jgi:hypothetical protein